MATRVFDGIKFCEQYLKRTSQGTFLPSLVQTGLLVWEKKMFKEIVDDGQRTQQHPKSSHLECCAHLSYNEKTIFQEQKWKIYRGFIGLSLHRCLGLGFWNDILHPLEDVLSTQKVVVSKDIDWSLLFHNKCLPIWTHWKYTQIVLQSYMIHINIYCNYLTQYQTIPSFHSTPEKMAIEPFPKRQNLDSSKLESLQSTISNLMKMVESSPNR